MSMEKSIIHSHQDKAWQRSQHTCSATHSHVLTFHIHFDDLLKGHIKTCNSHTSLPRNEEKFKCQPDLHFTFSRIEHSKITMKSPLASVYLDGGIFQRPILNSRGWYCDCFLFKIEPMENTMTAKHVTMLHAGFKSS